MFLNRQRLNRNRVEKTKKEPYMSDYKRLVAYIYLYDKGTRVKNIGFTKVESKNGECRIQVHIKGAWMAEGLSCRAYIFYREAEKLKGISIGEFIPKNGSGELKTVTTPENIMGSGLKLGQMAGIVILTEGSSVLATRWDDGPVSFEHFTFHTEDSGRSLVEDKEKRRSLHVKKYRRPVEADIRAAQTGEEAPDEAEETELFTETQEPSFWEKIKREKERIQPFGRDAGGEYVSMEPADLLAFRDMGRYLVNNSFLLHGFYNYGHILLGIRQEDGAMVLGIPGDFYVQEKVMASLFGFPEFKKSEDTYGSNENRGYWLRKLEG